jgi:hypothetical protein
MKDLLAILSVIILLLLFLAFGRSPARSATSRPRKRDGVDDDAEQRERD